MENREKAIEIFHSGVEAVKPNKLIPQFLSVDKNILQIGDLKLKAEDYKHVFVIGFGKASASMAQSVEEILGDEITDGHVITKYHHSVSLKTIKITEAGHPLPDEKGIEGTKAIISILNKAGENDLVICLISGGGSSLLVDVPKGSNLKEIEIVNNCLLKSGADIHEINCVRKQLSEVKGGGLAKKAFPATLVSLIVSDVIGDNIGSIASGPTVAEQTSIEDTLAIIKKYKLNDQIPKNILNHLYLKMNNQGNNLLQEDTEIFSKTKNIIVGNNITALDHAKEKAEWYGYITEIISNSLQGDIRQIANYILRVARQAKNEKPNNKICFLFGGEPTVQVAGSGSGCGGRNQHLALLIASQLYDTEEITFLSAGTDGTDGTTEAAGAVVDSNTIQNAKNMNLSMDNYLAEFNSYNFFKQVGGLINTDPTLTNVMDLMVVLIN